MREVILITICFLLVSCDKINQPFIEENSTSAQKKILIEKFTGHKCSNCPDATRTIKEIKEFYGDNIISVSIHPSYLSSFTGIDLDHSYDFRTDSGDSIANQLGVAFMPIGSINRISGGSVNNGLLWYKDDWRKEVDKLLFNQNNSEPLPKNIEISINNSLNQTDKTLTSIINIDILNNISGPHNIVAIITEDKIISPQDDGNTTVLDYEHNNVFRCAINGVYGEPLNDLQIGSNLSKEYSVTLNEDYNINWNKDWNKAQNCNIIIYIYNTETLVIEDVHMKKLIN